jgi:hypothetical protein
MGVFNLKRKGAVSVGLAGGLCAIVPAGRSHAAVTLDFNTGATDTQFSSNFSTFDNRTTNSTTAVTYNYNQTGGVLDQPGLTAGGGIVSSNGTAQVDATAIYTPTPVTLADGQVHTLSEFAKVTGTPGGGDKYIQLGFISTTTNITGGLGFNANNKFVSMRILGNNVSAEVQATSSATGGTQSSATNAISAGSIQAGDWVKLTLSTQETNTSTGAFTGNYTIEDWGQSGTALSSVVLSNIPYNVTVSNIAGVSLNAGFRTAEAANAGGVATVNFDNFSVDAIPEPTSLGLLGLGGAALVARRRKRPISRH